MRCLDRMLDENCSINRLSRLYHLKPLGIGTPNVESLTGYLKRLAEAHSVSVGILLVKEIIPSVKKGKPQNGLDDFLGKDARFLNSFSKLSKETVRTLEEKTFIDGLTYLTMGIWEDVLNSTYMLREYQAWCPICHEESLDLERPIYEQLLWNFRDIEICMKHQVKLVDRCPYCNSQIGILSRLSRVGFCNKCNSWLGLKQYENSQISCQDMKWHYWVCDNLGELIASAPLLGRVSCLYFSKNINNLILMNPMSLRSLARNINVSHSTITKWTDGRKPILKSVLNLSFMLDIPVIDILTRNMSFVNNVPNNEKTLLFKENIENKFDIKELKELLNDVINSDKGLSLNEISLLTGVNRETIKRNFSSEVDKLKILYKKSLEQVKIDKLNLIKNTMKSLYHKGIYPSMKSLKRELGKRVIINDAEREVWIATLKELGCTCEVSNKSNS